jgi:hypothetical protein
VYGRWLRPFAGGRTAAVPMIDITAGKRTDIAKSGRTSEWSPYLYIFFDTILLEGLKAAPAELVRGRGDRHH